MSTQEQYACVGMCVCVCVCVASCLQSLVVSISALASLGQTCTGLLDQVTTLIPRTSSSPVPSTHTHNPANHTDTPTTNTHSTRTNTRERRHGAVQASPRHTTQRPPLTPQQLAVCLWATARVLSGPEALLTSMGPLTLFRRAAPLLAQYVCELSDQGLAMVAYAYVSAEVSPADHATYLCSQASMVCFHDV